MIRHFSAYRTVVLALLPLAVVVVSATSAFRVSQRGSLPATIPQPAEWIAFEADSLHTGPGFPDLIGRHYRSSDGSTSHQQQTRDGSIRLVVINNIPRARVYAFNSVLNKWFQQPLVGLTPDGRRRIPLWRVSTSRLTPHPAKIEGLNVHEYIGPKGARSLLAPELNFFSLVEEQNDGSQLVFSNIQLREPSRSVFELPPGVVAEERVAPNFAKKGGPGH